MEQLARSPGFVELRRQIVELAELRPSDRVLDVGAGTGLLTLATAPAAERVIALDVSPAMCDRLEQKLDHAAVANVDVLLGDAAHLSLADASIDVVVSNYCLHHLRDAEKRAALDEIRRVLRPGGRLVFGDMMFNVGVARARDRALILRFIRAMLRRGPAGLIRLMKNALRVLAGRGEHPRDVGWWRDSLTQAGFEDVSVRALAHEGGVAAARRPH